MLQQRDKRRDTGDVSEPRLGRASSLLMRLAHGSYRIARRIVVATVGTTVVVIGLIMFVTPGPALVVVPLGLAILAFEFAWARRLLRQMRDRAARLRDDYWGNNRKGRE